MPVAVGDEVALPLRDCVAVNDELPSVYDVDRGTVRDGEWMCDTVAETEMVMVLVRADDTDHDCEVDNEDDWVLGRLAVSATVGVAPRERTIFRTIAPL